MDWISLIQTLGGIVGGFGIGSFSKSRRRNEKAEADKAVKDVYEERIRDLHSIIDNFNTTERSHSERISELNKALDDKSDGFGNRIGKPPGGTGSRQQTLRYQERCLHGNHDSGRKDSHHPCGIIGRDRYRPELRYAYRGAVETQRCDTLRLSTFYALK